MHNKPIVLLDLTKLTTTELVALRRDGFNVPPNIYGGKLWFVPVSPRQPDV